MKFLGYKRADGKVGVRNKIFILPSGSSIAPLKIPKIIDL